MNDEEFLEFWKNYQWTDPKPVHYRLYYDDNGMPLFYSHEELFGKYIDVTPKQFALQDWSVRIIDGKIIHRKTTRIAKLVPADSGTLCHTQDVTVVVIADQPGQYWKKKENVVETN